MMRAHRVAAAGGVLLAVLWITPAAMAQDTTAPPPTGLTMTTPYAGVAVEPGADTTFALGLAAPDGQRISLSVADAPGGWTTSLTGGGFVVDEVIASQTVPASVKLDVSVPADAAPGEYAVRVHASSDAGEQTDLEVHVRVAEAVSGGIRFTTDFPALRGSSTDTFTYTLTLANDTPEEVQFGLDAAAPAGWTVEARPSGQSKASTVTVAAGESTTITVDADPPNDVPAGIYPLAVRATGGGKVTEAQLGAEITGDVAITLATADQRLNADVVAGRASELSLVVANTGTAPLLDVALSATPPSGWTVDFTPPRIDQVAPGQSVDVTATITPSGDAIAGDYLVSLRAGVPETSSSIDVRTTVKTSAIWGAVGIGVIVVAVGGLALVFQRFGRR